MAPSITITDPARAEIRRLAEEGLYPRLVLAKAGCCSYRFLIYPDKAKGADTLTRIDDLTFIIDPQVQEFSDRLTVDYGRVGIRRDFSVKPL
jgi:Fe-S cluster assembly iron-binding protein IscA